MTRYQKRMTCGDRVKKIWYERRHYIQEWNEDMKQMIGFVVYTALGYGITAYLIVEYHMYQLQSALNTMGYGG